MITLSDNQGKIIPENELTQYFLTFRTDDLIDAFETNEFTVDYDESEIIPIILEENTDNFRKILHSSIIKSIVLINISHDNGLLIDKGKRELRNKIKIKLVFPTNINISELNSQEHEGFVVTFEAKVSNWSRIRSVTTRAIYECQSCGEMTTLDFVEKMNQKCTCNGKLDFYKPIESEDTRRITLREIVDDLSGKRLPYTISADIYGYTVKDVALSDKLIVTGVFRSVPLLKENGKIAKQFIPTIQVICVRNMQDVNSSLLPSKDLINKFKSLEKKKKLIDSVIDGFAYNIYKKRNEKKAILCSLIGSKWIGQHGKGNPPMIHVLFVGDPDTYKSTIMKYITNVYDNCVLADATTVSNAGIKASAVKMDDGRMSIQAGLLPEHNGGVVFLDEFGDLKQDIYADLKAPMVDGRVSKHVAGEDFNAKAETGILASMNPIEGVYENNKTIYENLAKLEKPLITRFDMIFLFLKSSPDYDSFEIRKHFKKCDINGKPTDFLTDEEIKLFINYVKTIDPKITDEAIDTANSFFEELEKKGGEKSGTETRSENAVMKIAVALAKWHMSDEVKSNHVNEAIDLFRYALGTLDLDMDSGQVLNERALKKTKDGRREAIRLAYESTKDENGYVFPDDLVEEIKKYKVFTTVGAIKTELNTLRMESKLSEKNNMYKIDLSI